MRYRPVRDVLSVFGTGERAYRADPIDEYRELTILAGEWERGSLEMGVADGLASIGYRAGHSLLPAGRDSDGGQDDQCDRDPLGYR